MDALLILHQLLNWLGECRSRPRRAWRLVFSGNRTSRRLRSAPPVPSALPPSGVSLVDAGSPPPACSPLPSLPLRPSPLPRNDSWWTLRASGAGAVWSECVVSLSQEAANRLDGREPDCLCYFRCRDCAQSSS